MRCLVLAPMFAAGVLATPHAARAQHTPFAPLPFAEVLRTYALHGCGDGYLSDPAAGAARTRVFCLDGTATVGIIQGGDTYQVVFDLTGTRQNGFSGRFVDANNSELVIPTTFNRDVGGPYGGDDGYYVAPDLTGRVLNAYALEIPPSFVGSGGVTLGPAGRAELAYVPAGASSDADTRLGFALTVTATPEPVTLALTLGGFAVLGVGARRRRAA